MIRMEKVDNHVAGDALLVGMGSAEDAGLGQAPGEASVRHVALDRGKKPVAGHGGVHYAFKCRVGGAEGWEVPQHGLEGRGVHGKDAVEGRPCTHGAVC